MTQPRIFLSPPDMDGQEQAFLSQVFDENYIAPYGPSLDRFEQALAETVGMPHVVAVNSGTAALHLILRLIGVQAGDRVFCSDFTFVGAVNPIRYLGAEPVFIDSDEASWNMDPDLLSQALQEAASENRLPKAVVVVHLYGQCADMGRIMPICRDYGVPVIEDAAEAFGATCNGVQAGALGDYAFLSFNGNKVLTTGGGGAVLLRDQAEADRVLYLATQARDFAPHYQHQEVGYNYRMSNVLAAIGLGQLSGVAKRIQRKKEIFEAYQRLLSDLSGVSFMPLAEFGTCSYWLSCITFGEIPNSKFVIRNGLPSQGAPFGREPNEESLELGARSQELGNSKSQISNDQELRAEAGGRKSEGGTTQQPNDLTTQQLREAVRLALEAQNIESRPLWKPMHMQPAFEHCRYYGGAVSERLFETGLCLPSGSSLSDADLARVVGVVKSALRA